MSRKFKRISTHEYAENDGDYEQTEITEFESTYTMTLNQQKTIIQEFEYESPLIGKYIKLKDINDNVDCITYQIQSISSPIRLRQATKTINSENKETIPELVAESTNQFLLLHRYKCINGTKTEQTDFCIAFIVILLQVLSYIIMAYYLISVRYSDIDDRKENCYGPKCNIDETNCMDIKTGAVAAILLFGYLWADFINSFRMLMDSFNGFKLINHKQCFGSIIILFEVLLAASCGILVAVYSYSDFDAINGAVGILCVHDLDEKIYSAMEIIDSNWKRLLALITWMLLSIVVAMCSACIYNETFWSGGSYGQCKQGQFKCDTGRCIWEGFVCNGVRNCRTGIDEKQNCNFSEIICPDDMFRCESTGSCIDIGKICDGVLDCKDGSDEGRKLHCSSKLEDIDCGETPKFVKKYDDGDDWYMDIINGYFKCNNGQCIEGKYLCDRVIDCVDRTDEYPLFNSINKWPYLRQCPYAKLIECGSDQVLCKVNGKCIGKLRICDGINDCPDGQDEKGCPWIWGDPWCELLDHYQCGSQIAKIDKKNKTMILFENKTVIHYEKVVDILDYAGGDGKCLPMKYRCDGIKDCEDGDDEDLCELFECEKNDEYQCQNGQCIPDDWSCTHIPFCEHDQYGGANSTFFSNCDWSSNPVHMNCNETVTNTITENGGYWSKYIIYIPCPIKAVQFTTCNNYTSDYNTIIEGFETDSDQIHFVSDDAGWLCEINYSASTYIINSDRFKCNTTYIVYVGGKYQQYTSGNYGFQVFCSMNDFDP